MRSLQGEQSKRGLRRKQARPEPGQPGFFDPLAGASTKNSALPVVPVTSKQDAVWRRLGELALHMRQNGVSELKIQDLLKYHTPGQIELAFKTLAHVHPDGVADVILRGRFGYRAGIKKNKQPPDTRQAALYMKQERLKEARCPRLTPQQAQDLLDQFLAGLVEPEEPQQP